MHIPRDDIQSGQLAPDTLKRAVRELQDVGYVTLEQVIDPAAIKRVYEAFLPLFHVHIAQPDIKARLDSGNAYIGMHVPFVPPFSDETICANRLAVQVMEAAMGEIVCSLYHSNTTLQGSEIQPIHIDMPRLLFPGYSAALPPWLMVVNIPLIDFTLENGSTEIWPGTHLDPDDLELAERCAARPSVRMNVRVGDLVVRDLRVWHRGMPNHTTAVRTMLALVYNRPWFHNPPYIEIPRASYGALSGHAQEIFAPNVMVE